MQQPKPKPLNKLEIEKERVLSYLSGLDPSTDEYTVAVKNFSVLSETPQLVEWWKDVKVMMPIVTYVGGLLMVISHENLNVISTKAFGLVRRIF